MTLMKLCPKHGGSWTGLECDICLRDAPKDMQIGMVEVPTSPVAKSIDAVLAERGGRYGLFKDHAEVTQTLKAIFKSKMGAKWGYLADDQRESLEMIAHKLGRIINGDPNYADSWVDIAGYAQLVADRLEGKVR